MSDAHPIADFDGYHVNLRISTTPDGFSCIDDDAYDGTPSAIIGTGKTKAEAEDDFWTEYEGQFAPLTTVEDAEIEDLAWQSGNDWMTERERLEGVYGVRKLFR